MSSKTGVLAAVTTISAAALALALLRRARALTRTKLVVESPTPSDVHISQHAQLRDVATLLRAQLGVRPQELRAHGPHMAKLALATYETRLARPNGHYVVVVGMTPTPLGEGKSTTTVGLSQALGAHLNKRVVTCIRQPSMGPTFGVKGGAAGGGYAQVVPMEEFNLHMTGDIHAITAANNLFSAAIDARYYHEKASAVGFLWDKLCPKDKAGSRRFARGMLARAAKLGLPADADALTPEQIERFCLLDINPNSITWKRVTDTNDRYLRQVDIGLSPTEAAKRQGGAQLSRTTGFAITVASEIMAVLALATSLPDLRARLGRMIAAYSHSGEPLTADDFGVTGALTVLLKDALMPTAMQTLEGTPALVHCGPFANIAHGNSSVIADRVALKLVGADGYVLTEAGFGSDMGGEKFFNIKCRASGLQPSCAVLVTTVRALKLHSGRLPKLSAGSPLPKEYTDESVELVREGCCNMVAHLENIRRHGVRAVVAINRFATDTDAEIAEVARIAKESGAHDAVAATHFSKGGAGAVGLGRAVVAACESADPAADFRHLYSVDSSIKEKIDAIVCGAYGGSGANYSAQAEARIATYEADPALRSLPVCMSKTQYSLSDDPTKLGAPKDFRVEVKDIYVSAGAGFLVASLGAISFIPGLPIKPAYYGIDLDFDENGESRIVGLS